MIILYFINFNNANKKIKIIPMHVNSARAVCQFENINTKDIIKDERSINLWEKILELSNG